MSFGEGELSCRGCKSRKNSSQSKPKMHVCVSDGLHTPRGSRLLGLRKFVQFDFGFGGFTAWQEKNLTW